MSKVRIELEKIKEEYEAGDRVEKELIERLFPGIVNFNESLLHVVLTNLGY